MVNGPRRELVTQKLQRVLPRGLFGGYSHMRNDVPSVATIGKEWQFYQHCTLRTVGYKSSHVVAQRRSSAHFERPRTWNKSATQRQILSIMSACKSL